MMASRAILALIFVGPWLAVSLFAAEPQRAGFLLRHHNPRLQWEVFDGHIALSKLRALPTTALTANSALNQTEWKETLALNSVTGEESLNYRYSMADKSLSVEWKEQTLTIHDQQGKNVFHFTQSPRGEMNIISLQENKTTQELRANSLWHLAILHPAVFEQELMPRLEYVSGSWSLRQQAREVRAALDKEMLGNWETARREWRQAVADLASPEYRVRQLALTKLKGGGSSSRAYLRGLRSEEIEPEQARTISFIIQDGTFKRDDPEQVAAALVYDQNLWWEMLSQPSEQTRTAAAKHLSQLLERELPFNPSADDQSRVAQLRMLRESLQGDVKR